jgi:hypothetical protein
MAVARQIEGRISYRRAVKTALTSTIWMGAEGIKVLISGRLGGAEMARREQFKEGRIPLHTLRADMIMPLQKPTPPMAVLASRYGSVRVRFTVRLIWLRRNRRTVIKHLPVSRHVVTVNGQGVNSAFIHSKVKKSCYNRRRPNTGSSRREE